MTLLVVLQGESTPISAHRHCKARHLIKSRLDYPHKITVAHSDDAWLPDWSSLGTSRLGGSRTAESMVARWPDAKNLKALHQRTWLPSSHRCIGRDPSRAEVHRLNAALSSLGHLGLGV